MGCSNGKGWFITATNGRRTEAWSAVVGEESGGLGGQTFRSLLPTVGFRAVL
jgi:hypothetical protein